VRSCLCYLERVSDVNARADRFQARYGAALLMASLLAALATLAWGRCPDPLIDSGRELYVAWRLAAGEVLYRDVAYFNGPLSPYLNALVFRVLGLGIHSLYLSNLAVIVLLVGLSYRLLERLSDRFAATLAVLSFLSLQAFGQYLGYANYSFLFPYSHELTHGVLLLFCLLNLVSEWLRSESMKWALLSAFCYGLMLLTKIEFMLAGAVPCLVLLFELARRQSWREAGRVAGICSLFALTPGLLAWLMLSAAMPPSDALQGVFGSLPVALRSDLRALPYFGRIAGTAAPMASLGVMLQILLGYLLVLGPFAVLGLKMRSGARHPWLGLGISLFVAGGLLTLPLPFRDLIRALPLVLAAGLLFFAFQISRGGLDSGRRLLAVERMMFTLTALAFTAKIMLRLRVEHYGFALSVPAVMCFVLMSCAWLPEWIEGRGGSGLPSRAAGLGLIVVVALLHITVSAGWLLGKRFVIGQGADRFSAGPIAEPVNACLDELKRLNPRSLAVFPEGASINYLLRCPNPTPYVALNPFDLMLFGEEQVIESLAADPPEVVVLVHKDQSEYGSQYFGRDYAGKLMAWIKGNYRPGRLIGDEPNRSRRFGMRVMRRRD